MEIVTYIKCACANCGAVIDYRPSQAGQVVECPQCKEKSQLPEPARLAMVESLGPAVPEFRTCPDCGAQVKFTASSCEVCDLAKKRQRAKRMTLIGISVAAILCIGGIAGVFVHQAAVAKERDRAEQAAAKAREAAALAPAASTPHILIEAPRVRGPKSTNDLRPGKFVLEKRHGSDLMIAVGDIQNESENVHHSLRADLDLLDRKGAKIGTVSDYATELGPHQSWHFLATVSETNAMSVRFALIKEDN